VQLPERPGLNEVPPMRRRLPPRACTDRVVHTERLPSRCTLGVPGLSGTYHPNRNRV